MIAMVSLLLVAIARAESRQPNALPCIVIADVGVDDGVGLLLALASPELEILGIASTFGGHKDVRKTSANAKKLLEYANRADIPVYSGAIHPYGSSRLLDGDGTIVHGPDGFGGVGGDGDKCQLPGVSAAEWMVTIVRSRPGEITVVSFSPLTNLALALALEPNLPRLLKQAVIMGGAVYAPGNVSPLSEANFRHDAAAARVVFDGWGAQTEGVAPLVLVPLDVTMKAMLTLEQQAVLKRGGPAAKLLGQAFDTFQEGYCRLGGICDRAPVHDAMTITWLTHPEHFNRTEMLRLEIVVDAAGMNSPSHGMSLVDRRPWSKAPSGADVAVLLDIDSAAFLRVVVERVSTL